MLEIYNNMANEFSFSNNRGEILRSMMRRPETSKLIQEALSSPLGSTSRTKAKKIFSIMSKLNGGGMGGPGMGYSQTTMPETKIIEDTLGSSKGMVIFNKIPKTRIVYGKKPHDDAKEHNDLIKEMRTFSQGHKMGMGGPGYDGRGGLWDSIKSIGNSIGQRLNLIQPKSSGGNLTYTGAQPTQVNPVTGQSAPQPTPSNISYDVNQQFSSSPSGTDRIVTSGSNAPTLSDNGKVKDVTKTLDSINWAPSTSKPKTTLEGIDWTTGQSKSPAYTPSIVNPNGIMSTPGINMGNQPGLFKTDLANLAHRKTEPTNLATADLSVNTDTPLGTEQKETTTPPPTSVATTTTPSGFQMGISASRTDRHNNPAAFTTDIAKQAGLVLGVDYEIGDAFPDNPNLFTARLLGDPVEQTIKVIDKLGFTTDAGGTRWSYTNSIPGANNADWSKMSKEQKTAVIAQMYQYENGGGSGLTGDAATAAAALAAGVGSTNYGAYMANEKKGTLSELAAANEASIWDKYNIDEQRADVNKMQAENIDLPKDVTAYITARDQYLVQTDKEIANYIDNVMKNTDMSDPANAAKANAQLNYLYTLRGRQNQSYIGYLNDAVEQHTNVLNAKITQYNGDIAIAEKKLESANAISTDEWKTMAAGFAEMYTDLKNAPAEARAAQLEEAQILKAQAEVIGSGTKQLSQKSFIEQGNLLEGYTWDTAHMVTPGSVDLVEEVKRFYTDPNNKDVDVQTVIGTYIKGVQNYLSASEQKDATTGKGITSESKLENAKDSIKQLSNLANFFQSDDSNPFFSSNEERTAAVTNALASVTGAKQSLAGIMASRITNSGNVPKIMETVQELAPGGPWYTLGMGHGTSPNVDQFVNKMASATGNTLDESIARAIYAVYQRFVVDSNNDPNAAEELVKELAQKTPAQFAQFIGNLYAENYNPFE